MDDKKLLESYRNGINNARGLSFEKYIEGACEYYKNRGIAKVDKMPEPFRVKRKNNDGSFYGYFTSHAEPDFQGTLKGGRSIVFEAKYTRTDKMQRKVLTKEQMESLNYHMELGALSAVCIGIKDDFFFIPWEVWRDMKKIYGRQYVSIEDVQKYKIDFNGNVLFLNYIHGGGN